MTQIAIPVEVPLAEVMRKPTLGKAIDLCMELGPHRSEKDLQDDLKVDKAQFSRWRSGDEGVIWPKFARLMDACGNDAPVLWMLHQRGWDLHSLRRIESDLEREVRELREKLADRDRANAVLVAALRGGVAA